MSVGQGGAWPPVDSRPTCHPWGRPCPAAQRPPLGLARDRGDGRTTENQV